MPEGELFGIAGGQVSLSWVDQLNGAVGAVVTASGATIRGGLPGMSLFAAPPEFVPGAHGDRRRVDVVFFGDPLDFQFLMVQEVFQ